MGKSSGGGHTTSTVTQQNYPEEVVPYIERMLTRGEELSMQPYVPYSGQRMAEQGGDSLASQQMVRNIASSRQPALEQATGAMSSNMAAVRNVGNDPAYQFSQYEGYNPYDDFEAAQFSQHQFDPTQLFPDADIGAYMDPYLQNVLDAQKAQSYEDYQRAGADRNAAAVAAGAFGGSRGAVFNAIAERDQLTRMDRMQQEGLQSAYGDAQRMFGEDRAAMFAREQAQAGEHGRVQAGRAGEMARIQAGQAGEMARIQDGRAGEMGRVQAGQAAENMGRSQLKLDALSQSSSMAAQLAAMAEQARAADIQNAQLMETMGRANDARQQAALDLAYEDFMRQQNYPMEQLGHLSGMVHGLPMSPAGETVQSTPYNPVQQAMGMGVAGLGLYNSMGRG